MLSLSSIVILKEITPQTKMELQKGNNISNSRYLSRFGLFLKVQATAMYSSQQQQPSVYSAKNPQPFTPQGRQPLQQRQNIDNYSYQQDSFSHNQIVNKNQEVVIYSSDSVGRARGAQHCARAVTYGFEKVYYLPEGSLENWDQFWSS